MTRRVRRRLAFFGPRRFGGAGHLLFKLGVDPHSLDTRPLFQQAALLYLSCPVNGAVVS